jgi:hypothetical protein
MKKNRKQQLQPGATVPKAVAVSETVPQGCPKMSVKIAAQIPEERIRQRAQEIFQGRGGAPGHDLEDWLQAEREIQAEMGRTSQG